MNNLRRYQEQFQIALQLQAANIIAPEDVRYFAEKLSKEAEKAMTYLGDPKETLRAEQLTKTWAANRARAEAEHAQANLKLSVAEFKKFVTDLVLSKKGALPDVRDWKLIKEKLDKLEALEIQVKSRNENLQSAEKRLAAAEQTIREQSIREYNDFESTYHYPSDKLGRDEIGFRTSVAARMYLPEAQEQSDYSNPGRSALAIDDSTGYVHGYGHRNINNDHAKVKSRFV